MEPDGRVLALGERHHVFHPLGAVIAGGVPTLPHHVVRPGFHLIELGPRDQIAASYVVTAIDQPHLIGGEPIDHPFAAPGIGGQRILRVGAGGLLWFGGALLVPLLYRIAGSVVVRWGIRPVSGTVGHDGGTKRGRRTRLVRQRGLTARRTHRNHAGRCQHRHTHRQRRCRCRQHTSAADSWRSSGMAHPRTTSTGGSRKQVTSRSTS